MHPEQLYRTPPAKQRMAKQVSAEFIDMFEQLHNQVAEGHTMNKTFVHFADKLLAMLKDDFKKLYELEKKEHEELRAEVRPKTIWPATSSAPTGFVGGEVKGFTEDETLAEDCPLHWTQTQTTAGGGAMLGPTHNGRSYSTFSPPCNGCALGKRDMENGIWMSGFGGPIKRAEFQEPLHTPPISPITAKCPGAPVKAPQGAALCAVATTVPSSFYKGFESVGAAAPISPIDQIPEEHF